MGHVFSTEMGQMNLTMMPNRFVHWTLHDKVSVTILDPAWWHDNEREILNWMAEHLPRGIEHQQGMTVSFDTDQDRMMFLLRWA